MGNMGPGRVANVGSGVKTLGGSLDGVDVVSRPFNAGASQALHSPYELAVDPLKLIGLKEHCHQSSHSSSACAWIRSSSGKEMIDVLIGIIGSNRLLRLFSIFTSLRVP